MNITRKHTIAVASAAAAIAALGGTGVAMADTVNGPKPISQAFGMPESSICDVTTTPEWANIPGAPVGGWQKGWGSWLNAGKGGPACVRVLNYNASTHTWVVGK